jgi:hypothetical protein
VTELPDISLTIRESESSLPLSLEIDLPRRKISGPKIDIPRSALSSPGSSITGQLLKFAEGVGALQTSEKAVWGALNTLYTTGIDLGGSLFGGHEPLGEITALCREAMVGIDPRDAPPLISVDAPVNFFPPIEFLPLFNDAHPKRASSLAQAVRGFVAFGAIVRRTIPAEIDADLVLRNADGLPVAVFWDASLSGARTEAAFFKDLGPKVRARPKWPPGELAKGQATDALAMQLLQPAIEDEIVDQIHHFACHCEVSDEASGDWNLKLAAPDQIPTDISMKDLNAVIYEWRAKRRPAKGLPIIYMNACGSATVRPDSTVSFAKLFLLDNHNRGFIGTETDVPDKFAAEFSQIFYRRLLCGDQLGRALHEAKWVMLEEYGNPLGALYTLYAEPEICVERKWPEVWDERAQAGPLDDDHHIAPTMGSM